MSYEEALKQIGSCEYEIDLEEYTSDLFFYSFNRIDIFLNRIEKNAKLTLHKNRFNVRE